MPAAQATIPTASASRYLQQLCKHWSHKYAVSFTPEHGTIPFDETRVCTSTVYKLCAEGRLRHVRVSNAIRIPEGAIAACLHVE